MLAGTAPSKYVYDSWMRQFLVLLSSRRARGLVIALCLLCSPSVSDTHASNLPSKPAALLRGVVGGYQWKVEVRHGTEAGISPCVSVSLVKKTRGALGGKNTVCGSFSPVPLLSEQSTGAGSSKRAVVGMVFPADVTKVRVSLRNSATRNVSLHLLKKAKARRGHVRVLRYGAVAFFGAACVSQVVPYSKSMGEWQEPGTSGGCG